MKKSTLLIAVAAATAASFSFGPSEARAGDEGWAAFGGFVGGTLLSSFTSSQHRHSSGRHYRSEPSHGHRETVVVERPSGHYEYQTRQVWIEGHYDYERDECGRRIKVWHPGYYKCEEVKVWVEHCAPVRSCR